MGLIDDVTTTTVLIAVPATVAAAVTAVTFLQIVRRRKDEKTVRKELGELVGRGVPSRDIPSGLTGLNKIGGLPLNLYERDPEVRRNADEVINEALSQLRRDKSDSTRSDYEGSETDTEDT
jgi:hypothetical protein